MSRSKLGGGGGSGVGAGAINRVTVATKPPASSANVDQVFLVVDDAGGRLQVSTGTSYVNCAPAVGEGAGPSASFNQSEVTGLKAVVSGAGNFVPLTADDAGIRAAANAAIAAGGGVVLIPAGFIQILSPLPKASNLSYRGVFPKWDMNGGVVSSGTMLVGDGVAGVSPGTFNCFEHNPNDGTLPGSPTALFATGIGGFSIENIALTRFNYGIKFGANQTCGVHTLRLDNIIAWDNGWGIWLENCHNLSIGTVIASDNKFGGYAHIGSGGALWDFGNDYIENVIVQNASRRMVTRATKGVVIEARGAASHLNSVTYNKITAIGPSLSLYTQGSAGIFTNGSADIAISANIDYFAVDSVVYFGTAGSGFTLRPYFVVTNTPTTGGAGTIRVATVKGGSPVVASGSTSSAISVKAASLLDIGGRGDSTSVGGTTPIIFHSKFLDLDLEAGGTAHLAVSNIQDVQFATGIINGSAGTIEVVVSGAQADTVFDFGSQVNNVFVSSATAWSYRGVRPAALWTLSTRPQGLVVASAGDYSRINLTSGSTGDNTDLGDIYGGPSGWRTIKLNNVLTHRAGSVTSGGTVDVFGGNVLYLQGNATLPAVNADNAGTVLFVLNGTAGAVTVSTSSGQLFDNAAGTTTYSIAAARSAILYAVRNGSSYFWGVVPGRA